MFRASESPSIQYLTFDMNSWHWFRPGGALLLAALSTTSTHALSSNSMWGEEGHRIVCEIAAQRLSAAGRALVSELLAPESQTLPGICTWADSVRSTTHRQTSAYHYINLPRGAQTVDLARDCADVEKRCVIWAIEHYARILADRSKPLGERCEALKFVAHFVGDLHQPLHVSYADDQGGNLTRVEFFGDAGRPDRPRDLHSVWDTRILTRAGAQWQPWAARLGQAITPEDARRWETIDVIGWANESYAITSGFIYARLPADRRISDDYYAPALQQAEVQLQKAGVRLAYLLNRS
jgi:nuclease S1